MLAFAIDPNDEMFGGDSSQHGSLNNPFYNNNNNNNQ
jgi:hypothetical protein